MAVVMRQVGTSKTNRVPSYYGPRVDTKNYLTQKLRVCAYCRVSTELEEQQSSFDTQVQFYTMFINSNPNWELVEIYADDGISGSQIYWRNGFSKMIEDAKNRKFDLVLTKSFTRFARNTVDSVETVRLFSSLGIDIYFEDKSLHSLDQKGEMMVTLYSAFAQEELRNLSQNVTWGYQKSFERGEVLVTGLLGYRSKDKVISIVQQEAITVRLIYKLFLEGYTYYQIAKVLKTRNVKTKRGNVNWLPQGIKNILQNEKYTGNALCQKTICVDYLTKTRVKNTGQRKQYYVKNSHPAIVPNEIFIAVQAEIRRRELFSSETKQKDSSALVRDSLDKGNNYSSKYYLSNILFCEDCGSPFRRYTWTARGNKKIVWMCKVRKNKGGREKCPVSPSIEESGLHLSILKALQKANLGYCSNSSDDISDFEGDNMQKLIVAEDKLAHLNQQLACVQNDTNKQQIESDISIAELNIAYYQHSMNIASKQSNDISVNDFDLSVYSDDLLKQFVDKILVTNKGELKIHFKIGVEIKIASAGVTLA